MDLSSPLVRTVVVVEGAPGTLQVSTKQHTFPQTRRLTLFEQHPNPTHKWSTVCVPQSVQDITISITHRQMQLERASP